MRYLATVSVALILSLVMGLVTYHMGLRYIRTALPASSVSGPTPAPANVPPTAPAPAPPAVALRPQQLPAVNQRPMRTVTRPAQSDTPAEPDPIRITTDSPPRSGGIVVPSRTPREQWEWELRERIRITRGAFSGEIHPDVAQEQLRLLNGQPRDDGGGTIEITVHQKKRATTRPEQEQWDTSLDRR